MRWLLGVAVLCSACAYVPRVVKLTPPSPQAGANCVAVQPFVDARSEGSRVGVVRNGLYWPTASVRTDDAVADWVTQGLRASFPAPTADCASTITVRGVVRELFVDEYWNLDGRLRATLVVERGSQHLVELEFEGTASQLSNFGSVPEFEGVLRATLAAWLAAVVPQVQAAARGQVPLGPLPAL